MSKPIGELRFKDGRTYAQRHKPIVSISEWVITARVFSPEGMLPCLSGVVHGHPRITDGHRIVSSPIVCKDEVNGIVETENTLYMLKERAV